MQELHLQERLEQCQEAAIKLSCLVERIPNFEFIEVPKRERFVNVLKEVLPYVGSDLHQIIRAEVVAALVVEGYEGAQNAERDRLTEIIVAAIEADSDKKLEALWLAERMMRQMTTQ